MKRLAVVVLAVLLWAPVSRMAAQEPAQAAKAVAEEGVRLYDQGRYEEAIQKYNRALEIDPGLTAVLYERGMTYLVLKNYDKCMEDARAGQKASASQRASFFLLEGLCYSQQGIYEKAVETFNRGLKEYPGDEQLHFNLAVSLSRAGKFQEARSQYKEVLRINPARASAIYSLALIFQQKSYDMPALFMYLRFLMAEPDTERSSAAVNHMLSIVGKYYPKQKGKNINIYFSTDNPVDEGDFGSLRLALSISGAVPHEEKQSIADSIVNMLRTTLEITGEHDKPPLNQTFVWKEALAPLINMQRDHVLEAFLYRELSLRRIDGVQSWLEEHTKEQQSLAEWLARHDKGAATPIVLPAE